jgi:predicted nucleic acid-binding protein
MGYLLDTCILSALLKKGETAIVCQKWIKEHSDLYTSVVVLYEIESGLLHGRMPKLIESLHKFIRLAPIEVLDVNWEISSLAAQKRAECLRSGIILHAQDLLIGATAKHHGLLIVTDNVKDFRCWGELENPLKKG